MDDVMQEAHDWEIDAHGLYVATRAFLIRRGYCCANQCRNCPYINWHTSPTWRPLPAEAIRRTTVSPKALAGARKALTHYEWQGLHENQGEEEASRQTMIAHYHLLLERWEPSSE